MLTPMEEARLRDDLCVVLLEATTPLAALAQLRADVCAGRLVYDPDPDTRTGRRLAIQPRDQVRACATCGGRFVARYDANVYCTRRCQQRSYRQPARSLLRQRYPAVGLGPCPVRRAESTAPAEGAA